MRQCPACQAETPARNKFCGECGGALPTGCPAWGHQNPPRQKFCGECGAGLAGAAKPTAAAAPPPASPVTTHEPAPSPPAPTGTASSYRRADPRDHSHRALSAPLGMQGGLKALREDVRRAHGVEFRVRMGINTGGVVVGAIGTDLRMDYTAVGDTTSLAARFLGLAQPGQIVVSQRTQQLTDGFFVFEDLGEFQVKGKTEPVRAYALMSEVHGRTRLAVSKERGLTPLVGRDHELQRLTEAYRRADGGHAAIVLLEGDPGVGKSRLLYEFLQTLDGAGIVELEATCASYYRSMAYRAISELLRRHLALSEGVDREDLRKRVAERLQELGLDGEERAVLVAHFLGVSAPPEFLNRVSGAQLKERTFGVLRDLFLRTSESAL